MYTKHCIRFVLMMICLIKSLVNGSETFFFSVTRALGQGDNPCHSRISRTIISQNIGKLVEEMKIESFLLFCSFLSLSYPAVCASDSLLSPKGVNYEVASLMSVKSKVVDSLQVLSGWDINSVDPCTWNMVACSAEGYVISLEMVSVGLAGTLSPSIGNLSHLSTLLIQNNRLSGSVPADIGKLSELQTLDLSGNQFDGEIPSSLGFLSQLSYLRLSRNRLSGQIPSPVANLTGLSFLDLSYNNLSGPTPRILAKGYSVLGNTYLCDSQPCSVAAEPASVLAATAVSRNYGVPNHWILSLATGIGCMFVASVTLVVCWVHWYKSRLLFTSYEQDCEFEIDHVKRFTVRELQIATENFSPKNILGQGGFGVVYKGRLLNGTMVAVKRLKDPNYTGEVQFQTEVEMIGLALHRNLLRLYGFCMTPDERLLVYPYMTNGSVADRLRDKNQERPPSLDWTRRMRIALGAARGLLYLHEQCNPKIIHRDVKAANILLDESFEAIVGDFGLAKLLDRRESHVTTAVRGTVGHIAPEYLSTGQSSEKTDVFGFGILLLELITGQKALNAPNCPVQKGMILDWVKKLKEENRLETMVDGSLEGRFDEVELEKAVDLALHCTKPYPSIRPKMSEVLKVLEGLGQPGSDHEDRMVLRACSFSREYHGDDIVAHDESSFIIEAMELSGPR